MWSLLEEGVSSPPEGKAGDGVERVSIVILLRILHHDGDIRNECLHRLLAQTTNTALPLGAHATDIEPSVLSVMSVDFADECTQHLAVGFFAHEGARVLGQVRPADCLLVLDEEVALEGFVEVGAEGALTSSLVGVGDVELGHVVRGLVVVFLCLRVTTVAGETEKERSRFMIRKNGRMCSEKGVFCVRVQRRGCSLCFGGTH